MWDSFDTASPLRLPNCIFPCVTQFEGWAGYTHVASFFFLSLVSTLLLPGVYPNITVPWWAFPLLCTSAVYYISCISGAFSNTPSPAALPGRNPAAVSLIEKSQGTKLLAESSTSAGQPSGSTRLRTHNALSCTVAAREPRRDVLRTAQPTPSNSHSHKTTLPVKSSIPTPTDIVPSGLFAHTDVITATDSARGNIFGGCSESNMRGIMPEAAASRRVGQSGETHCSVAVVEVLAGQCDNGANVSEQRQGAGGMVMQVHTAIAGEPVAATRTVCVDPEIYMQEAGNTQHVFQYIPYVSQVTSRAHVHVSALCLHSIGQSVDFEPSWFYSAFCVRKPYHLSPPINVIVLDVSKQHNIALQQPLWVVGCGLPVRLSDQQSWSGTQPPVCEDLRKQRAAS